MGPKTPKHNKSNHRKGLEKAEQLFSNDVDDLPSDQSSNAKAIVPANPTYNTKYQSGGRKQLLDTKHVSSEAVSSLPSLQSDLSLSGSACKTNTEKPGGTSCLEQGSKVNRTKEDELFSDASIEANAVSGGWSAREKLMQQIGSLLRDSEFTVPRKTKLDFQDFGSKHTDDNVPVPIFKSETGPETSETSSTDVGYVTISSNATEPGNGASHEIYQSQGAAGFSVYGAISLKNCAEADIFLTGNECFSDFLNLLHHLHGICQKSRFQQHLCLMKQTHYKPTIDHDELNVHDEKCDNSSVPIEVDHLENSIKDTKQEEIKQLLLSISVILDKNQFLSALELTYFLEVIEQMKMEIDHWCHMLKQTETANEEETTLESASGGAKSFNDILAVLKTKPGLILTQLSNSLIRWQDFIETRAELEHELALEQDLLNTIHANINCSESLGTKLEAEHDLRLVEDKLEDYSEKLVSLRLCNRYLVEVLYPTTLKSNRSETGILASRLQNIKDSCSLLRSRLSAALDAHEMRSSTQMTSEPEKPFHSSYSQMEKSPEDFDKPSIARHVLKMILLLFLIILLLLFVSCFEPHLYKPLNRFRIPVPIHVRHVGTYPPM